MLFFVTQFLSLIILKYHVFLAPSLTSHHSIFFILFVGPILVTRCSFFFFFFFFFFFSSVSKLTEPSKKKKRTEQPTQEKKGKKKSKVAIELQVPPFLNYELWKLRIELRKQGIQTVSKYPHHLRFKSSNKHQS